MARISYLLAAAAILACTTQLQAQPDVPTLQNTTSPSAQAQKGCG
jgi:hypothetical protein